MASILDKIKQHKIKEVESAKTKRSEKELIASVSDSTRPFVHFLSTKKPAIIAEIKNKHIFMDDLKKELENIKVENGIPFDLSVLYINLKTKK